MKNKEILIAELCSPLAEFQKLEDITDEMMVEILEELKQMHKRKILARKLKSNI